MKFKTLLTIATLAMLFYSCSEDNQLAPALDENLATADRAPVVVPAGSVDALQDAVDAAGTNGTVILESGEHHESGTVTITERVRIIGEEGAVLISAVGPSLTSGTGPLEAAIYIDGADKTSIEGITFQAETDPGGTGILINGAGQVAVKENVFQGFQYSIMVEQGDKAVIRDNEITTTLAWLDPNSGVFNAHGITIINGDDVQVKKNKVTNSVFGIWACDRDGIALRNEVYGNLVGLILCKVPTGGYPLPDGNAAGAEFPATNWLTANNYAHDNFDAGILVIDGANNNTLVNNRGGNNGTYDIDLVGDSFRFGFFTPASYENRVNINDPNLTVKDCGVDNIVNGGSLADNSAEPCF